MTAHAYPLLIKQILDAPLAHAPGQRIIDAEGMQYDYRTFADRIGRAAGALRALGAEVALITGPVNLPPPPGVTTVPVESAREMHQAVMQNIHAQQLFIATAAVADYRPAETRAAKIKKPAEEMTLQEFHDIRGGQCGELLPEAIEPGGSHYLGEL